MSIKEKKKFQQTQIRLSYAFCSYNLPPWSMTTAQPWLTPGPELRTQHKQITAQLQFSPTEGRDSAHAIN